MLIWFIGTNVYSFADIDERRLLHFNTVPEDKAELIFTKTQLKDTKEEVVWLLKACNRANRLYSTDLKQEEKRLGMYRLARLKNVPMELFVVLRFKQVKEERKILLRSLRTCELLWDSIDLYQVCYTLPQFSKY